MTQEQKRVRTLFAALLKQPARRFPPQGAALEAPATPGVYVIYNPRGQVVHVGGTSRGQQGRAQRLRNHLHGASSFTLRHLKKDGSRLRCGYTFQCVVVRNDAFVLSSKLMRSATSAPPILGSANYVPSATTLRNVPDVGERQPVARPAFAGKRVKIGTSTPLCAMTILPATPSCLIAIERR